MVLFLVNIILIVGMPVALVLVTRRLQRWHREQVDRIGADWLQEMAFVRRRGASYTSPWVRNASRRSEQRQEDLNRIFWLLNIATTILAFIPLGFAGYNLIANNNQRALELSLLSLIILIVTKGALIVLDFLSNNGIYVVRGALMAAGGYLFNKVIKKAEERWKARKEKSLT